MNGPVAAAGIRLHDTHPARCGFGAPVLPVPDEHDLDPVQLVRIHLFALRPDDDGRLELHHGLLVLERAAIRHRRTLRFDLDEIEPGRTVVMTHFERNSRTVTGFRLREPRLQAVREVRFVVRDRQVVLDVPRHLQGRKFPVLRRIAVVLGMVGQREASPGVDPPHATHAEEAFRARLPFLEADLRQMLAAVLPRVRICARVFVDFHLARQIALAGLRGQRRAVRIAGRRRRFVIERARGVLRTLQGARRGPLRESGGFAPGSRAVEPDDIRRHFVERVQVVGDDERVRAAVPRMPPEAEQPFVFHQAMHEVPVGFALATVGPRRQRLRQRKLIAPLGLWMRIEHVGQYRVDRLVLPVPHVAAELEEVHPRREGQLVARQAAVRAEPARRMDVAVDREIRPVHLLDPQRHRLRDQRLELDVARGGHEIEHHAEVSAQFGTDHGPARHQRVVRQRRDVRLQQAILLNQATANRLCQFGHVHASLIFLFAADPPGPTLSGKSPSLTARRHPGPRHARRHHIVAHDCSSGLTPSNSRICDSEPSSFTTLSSHLCSGMSAHSAALSARYATGLCGSVWRK